MEAKKSSVLHPGDKGYLVTRKGFKYKSHVANLHFQLGWRPMRAEEGSLLQGYSTIQVKADVGGEGNERREEFQRSLEIEAEMDLL